MHLLLFFCFYKTNSKVNKLSANSANSLLLKFPVVWKHSHIQVCKCLQQFLLSQAFAQHRSIKSQTWVQSGPGNGPKISPKWYSFVAYRRHYLLEEYRRLHCAISWCVMIFINRIIFHIASWLDHSVIEVVHSTNFHNYRYSIQSMWKGT